MRLPNCRWHIKKAARMGVMLSSWVSGSLSLRRALSHRARALTYHRIGNDRRDPFCVATHDFEAQMTQVFSNVRTALRSAGTDFDSVVKFTTYLNRYFPDSL